MPGRYNATPPILNDGDVSQEQLDSRGFHRVVLAMSAVGQGDGISLGSAPVIDTTGTARPLAVHGYLFNGASMDRQRTPNVFKRINNVSVTAGTPVAIWTPTSGKKFRLMGYNFSVSVGGTLFLADSGNSYFWSHGGAANDQRTTPANIGNGFLSVLANNALTLDVGASGIVNGVVFGTEE